IIIIHLLMYLQNMIDSGQHKLFYNDLMHDEKVIDIINAITNLQEENDRLTRFKYNIPNDKTQSVPTITKSYKREYEDYKSRCEKAKKKVVRIIDYGYDYDGFNNVKDLKKLIDGLVKYAEETINILNGGDE
ncbi:MAG: hypothetical protein VZR33_07955, partial [Methanosphaera sp.]|nr:hypothetical protein [Methanosphaera sp.]